MNVAARIGMWNGKKPKTVPYIESFGGAYIDFGKDNINKYGSNSETWFVLSLNGDIVGDEVQMFTGNSWGGTFVKSPKQWWPADFEYDFGIIHEYRFRNFVGEPREGFVDGAYYGYASVAQQDNRSFNLRFFRDGSPRNKMALVEGKLFEGGIIVNGELKFHVVPYVKNGEAGVLETISGNFFGNAGTGYLKYGELSLSEYNDMLPKRVN